jgi:hypothetical protein
MSIANSTAKLATYRLIRADKIQMFEYAANTSIESVSIFSYDTYSTTQSGIETNVSALVNRLLVHIS